MRFFTVLLALKTLLNLIVWLPIPFFPQQPAGSRLSRRTPPGAFGRKQESKHSASLLGSCLPTIYALSPRSFSSGLRLTLRATQHAAPDSSVSRASRLVFWQL